MLSPLDPRCPLDNKMSLYKYITYVNGVLGLGGKGVVNGLGAKLIYMGYFASLLHPQEEKLGYYFQLGTFLGALKTHVLLSFLWSAFCKWSVINVTLLTLKIVVLKIQD